MMHEGYYLEAVSLFSTLSLRTVISVSLKALVVLAAASMALLSLRRASSSARAFVLVLALTGAMLIPALQLILPGFDVPLLPAGTLDLRAPEWEASKPLEFKAFMSFAATSSLRMPLVAPGDRVETIDASAVRDLPGTGSIFQRDLEPASRAGSESTVHWSFWFLCAWMAGSLLLLLRLILGFASLGGLVGSSTAAPERIVRLAERLRLEIGLLRRVEVLFCGSISVPVVTGLTRPRILLPVGSEAWRTEVLSSVLLHELAHVKRGDVMHHLLAHAACILHWFNPLAWVLARRLIIEVEKACDDLVLRSRIKPSVYAHQLLEFAAALRASARPGWAAVGMAHTNDFKERVMAILDSRANRRSLGRKSLLLSAALFILSLTTLAALQPWTDTGRASDETAVKRDLPQGIQGKTKSFTILNKPVGADDFPVLLPLKRDKDNVEVLSLRLPPAAIDKGANETNEALIIVAKLIGRTEIIAPADGTIEDVRTLDGGGTMVRTVQDNGIRTTCKGLDTAEVKIGDKVRFAQRIGWAGGGSADFTYEIDISGSCLKLEDFLEKYNIRIGMAESSGGKGSNISSGGLKFKDEDDIPSVWPLSPVRDCNIELGFGWAEDPSTKQRVFHNGIDIPAPIGSSVVAAASGAVAKAAEEEGYGKVIVLSHDLGYSTVYAHLDSFAVSVGDVVELGEKIGEVGSSGGSVACHLHYEVRFDDKPLDPVDFVGNVRAERLRTKQADRARVPSIWPLESTEAGRVTSGWGIRINPFNGEKTLHRGVDIAAVAGAKVLATADGVVVKAKDVALQGKYLVIDHLNGFQTAYHHLGSFLVEEGREVKRGRPIATIGNSGMSTAPHLHYEVHHNGFVVDPKEYITDHPKYGAAR